MKVKFSLILFFQLMLIPQVYSYDAIVIVLEAPLFKAANSHSLVLQTLRKGSRVYVPNEIGNLDDLPEFIQTYDRVGNIAYVPKNYIKIITNDLSENKMPISFPKNDPTDYRLEEPIPVTYPYNNVSFYRATFALFSGNNAKDPFDYNSTFKSQNFSYDSGIRFSVTHKIKFDQLDRYYFGFLGAIGAVKNTIAFKNTNNSIEYRSQIRLGPIVTYDAFKNEKYRLTVGTGFTYNFHKSTLEMKGSAGKEQRLFSGFSLSPIANTQLQICEILPLTDLILGSDISLFLPHSEKAISEISVPELWSEDSPTQIQAGLKAQVSFFLGVQVRY